MVKKLLMIILVNVLLYSLVACTPMPPDGNSQHETVSIIGKWKCDDMNQLAGIMFDFADGLSGLDMFGTLGNNMDISLEMTFYQNGTYQLDMAVTMVIVGTEPQTKTGTYSWQNNQLILDGEVMDITLYDNNKLMITSHTMDGYIVRLEFERVI